jgi:hypothetical protein
VRKTAKVIITILHPVFFSYFIIIILFFSFHFGRPNVGRFFTSALY